MGRHPLAVPGLWTNVRSFLRARRNQVEDHVLMGRAGILLDPTDDDAWGATITAVAGDPDHRAALIAAGAIHQEHFRWSRVAAQAAAVHAEALGR